MKILVLGGTGYFGRRLVELLVADEHDVTVASRGNKDVPCADQVTHLKLDRKNLPQSIPGHYDLAFDQLGFDSNGMKSLDQALDADFLVFTSSLSVYDWGVNHSEDQFDPKSYTLNFVSFPDVDYQEGKRQAECYLLQSYSTPCAVVRLPFVMGPDDSSGRILWHFEKLANSQPIYLPNQDVESSFASSHDAARALAFIGLGKHSGIFNVGESNLTIGHLINIMAAPIAPPNFVTTPTDENHSPFGLDQPLSATSEKLQALGFRYQQGVTKTLSEFAEAFMKDR